jgi:signal transduction histidine kinase
LEEIDFRYVLLLANFKTQKHSYQNRRYSGIRTKKEGDMALFSVSDTGIGIKKEDLDNIFQKFTQLDSGDSRKYEGTGIGLANTKKLVELQGGNIRVESKYGEGSTFTVMIPLVAIKEISG